MSVERIDIVIDSSTDSDPIRKGEVEWPEEIRMTGLPLDLQGWNRKFYKTREMCEGCPVYRLDAYTLYVFFHIIGGYIKKENGRWKFYRECDWGRPSSIMKRNIPDQSTPFGEWTSGAYVSPVTKRSWKLWDLVY